MGSGSKRILLAALVLAAAPAREPLGQYRGWGAFREGGRCFAIAKPATGDRGGAFLAIGSWPGQGAFNQVQARLGAPDATAATLTIGTQTFPLVVDGSDARAPDARTDRRIVAALRGGSWAAVRAQGARRLRQGYPLAGAASAIDAAAVACLPRGAGG